MRVLLLVDRLESLLADRLGLRAGPALLAALQLARLLLRGLGHLVLRPPELLLALAQTHDPRREEAAGDAPRPWLLVLEVVGRDLAPGHHLDQPHHRVEANVAAHAGDEAVGDGVGEGHDGDGQEGRHGVAQVLPVHVDDGRGHHATDQDEDAARGPRRDRGEDGREEDRDEEAKSRDDGRQTRLAALGDTGAGLDKGRHGRGAEEGADGDAYGVNHVGDRGALEVLGVGVDQAGEARNTVQRTGAVQDVDVQEGDEGETELAAVAGNVPLLHVERFGDGVEVDNVLEEVELRVADVSVREVRDGGAAGPRDDADEQDANDDGALEAVHHEQNREDTTAEDSDPHAGEAHLVPLRTGAVLEPVLGRTSGELDGRVGGANDEADTLAVGETDDGEEEADTDARGDLDAGGDGAGEPLAHAEDGEGEEDPAFNEDGGQGNLEGNRTRAVVADDGVGEVGVEAHAGRNTNRPGVLSVA